MNNKTTNIIAFILLSLMFCLTLFGIKNDSLTMDEQAHLPAGYSYLTQQDMRLNPEHPPLIKDLSAVPLLFIKDINFPYESKSWNEDVNGQWDFGSEFFYYSNNPAEKMIFASRISMILVLILLGFFVFKWAKELFGNKAGLLSLLLFCFSPTIIANGGLVTTDIGAATGIFIATYYFIRSLRLPTKKNIILAGVFFGIAQLLKFSVVLLLPFFIFLALTWFIVKKVNLKSLIKNLILIFVIGFIVIWPVYQYHTWNYPKERQVSDAEIYLKDSPELIRNSVIWASDKPILRPYAQYFTGLFMVFHRVAGGNTTYFLGDISNQGWKTYFPIVYLIKVPLAFHILTLIALLSILFSMRSFFRKNALAQILNWIKSHFSEYSMLVFVFMYWVVSIVGSLNIGVRHLLPIFPFMIVLVSIVIISLLKKPHLRLKKFILFLLVLWQVFSVILIFPHFLAYFNELAGGAKNGHLYAVDSNLDWGQDLKRLEKWVDKNEIDKIYLDYFGGSKPEYYLGDRYVSWYGTSKEKEFPKGNYLAISATFLQGGIGNPIVDIPQAVNYYKWLDKYELVDRIGYSIFVFYID